jgi:hypothetical protein
MRYAILPITSRNQGVEAALGRDGSWARIGDRLVVWAANDSWAQVANAMRSAGQVVAARAVTETSGRLYLVTQVGNAFRDQYRDIPVVLDRGRHLVIALTPAARRRVGVGDGLHWQLRPLPRNETIVGLIDREAATRTVVPQIESLVSAVSGPAIQATMQHLTGFSTRHSLSSQFGDAAAWARDQLDRLGYNAEVRAFPMPGGSSANVIADYVGGTSAAVRGLVLITAHLDSINVAGGPSAPAPGADDNGSGAAGLLEIARVLSGRATRHDLRLILFGGEEEGLLGSQNYVDGLLAAERDRIRAVINMDMVAVLNTPNPTVLLEGAPVSSGQIGDLAAAASTYTSLTVTTSLNPFASDHVPFINAGIPAVLTIEGADSANMAIHTANDTIDRLDLNLATDIVRMNVAATAVLLGDEAGWLAPVLHMIMS